MNAILVLILLAIVLAIFVFIGWSFLSWIDGYKNAGVRMSFGEFQRIYELAPNEWKRHLNYTYSREEWIPTYDARKEIRGTFIHTSIVMKTLFDFWRLLIWQRAIDRKNEQEERLKKEKSSLKKFDYYD